MWPGARAGMKRDQPGRKLCHEHPRLTWGGQIHISNWIKKLFQDAPKYVGSEHLLLDKMSAHNVRKFSAAFSCFLSPGDGISGQGLVCPRANRCHSYSDQTTRRL